MGDATALAFLALLGMVVFAVRFASRAPRRTLLAGWFALSAFLFFRAGSALGWLGAAAVVLVLATVLVMRTTKRAGERTRYYLVYALVAAAGILAVWFGRSQIFAFPRPQHRPRRARRDMGADHGEGARASGARVGFRDAVATARRGIRPVDRRRRPGPHPGAQRVARRLRPSSGSSAWCSWPWPSSRYVWRSWFFAVDRPRWDLVADRPYSPVTLVPTLTGAVLLVQGAADSGPIVAGGWLLIVMLAFKIKQAPLVGRGASEERLVGEQGETERVPR